MNLQKFAQALRILADAIDETPSTAGPDVLLPNPVPADQPPEPAKRTRARKTEPVTPAAETATPAAEATPEPVETAPAAPAAEPVEVTQLEVRQALIALAKRTNNPEAPLSVLAKHGARNVSELSPRVFADVVRECAA